MDLRRSVSEKSVKLPCAFYSRHISKLFDDIMGTFTTDSITYLAGTTLPTNIWLRNNTSKEMNNKK